MTFANKQKGVQSTLFFSARAPITEQRTKRVSSVMCLFICLSTLFSFWLAFIVINIDTHVDIFSVVCRIAQAQKSTSCLIAMSNTQTSGNNCAWFVSSLLAFTHKMKTYHCRFDQFMYVMLVNCLNVYKFISMHGSSITFNHLYRSSSFSRSVCAFVCHA